MPTETQSQMRSGQPISAEAVLNVFRQESCLDLRKLAGQLRVDSRDTELSMVIDNLRRAGKLRRIGGKGRHTLFVISTFEA